MPRPFKRGDICWYESMHGSHYLAVLTEDQGETTEIIGCHWYALDIQEWLGIGSSFIKNLDLIGPMPEGAEWDVDG